MNAVKDRAQEYDEVELLTDRPDWNLNRGVRGVVVDVIAGEDFVTVEFFDGDETIGVHLVPLALLRVTARYARSPSRPDQSATA
jgi:hypothetical protein